MNKPTDYIFAYQIEPERLATWKRRAEWYVPSRDTHLTKVPWSKYNRHGQAPRKNKASHKSSLHVDYEEIEYMRHQLSQLTLSRVISLSRVAELAGVSKTTLYGMYEIDQQHVRHRKTMFNKLYQTFPEIKPFNRESQSPKQREVMWYEI